MPVVKFKRVDGDRLFLDSRDLIALIERSRPVAANEFARELSDRGTRVVITYTNLTELLPRNAAGGVDRPRALALVRRLEQLPLAFLRQPDLARREFEEALRAFTEKRSPRPLKPYVDQWWETFSKTPSEYVPYLRPKLYAALRRMTLSEEISALLDSGEDLAENPEDVAVVAKALDEDRGLHGSKRGVAATWLAAIQKPFIRFGWLEPEEGYEAFANFVKDTPAACPGWRIGVAVYEESRSNITSRVKSGDIADFSHVHFLPYVTHATLDRAWRSRCAQAAQRLAREGRPEPALERIYENLEAVRSEWAG
jgi:hypothetical protein